MSNDHTNHTKDERSQPTDAELKEEKLTDIQYQVTQCSVTEMEEAGYGEYISQIAE